MSSTDAKGGICKDMLSLVSHAHLEKGSGNFMVPTILTSKVTDTQGYKILICLSKNSARPANNNYRYIYHDDDNVIWKVAKQD